MSKVQYLTKKEMDSMNISNLDEARRNQIMAIKDSIVLNYEDTLDFASTAYIKEIVA